MEMFQILSCNGTLATCCNDGTIVWFLALTKKIFEIIQLIVPAALLIAGTIEFTRLSINPEDKKGFRKILNKIIAAFIVFMIPVLVDVVLTAVPNSFSVASCWEQAKVASTGRLFGSNQYVSTGKDSEKGIVWLDPKVYEKSASATDSKKDTGKSTTSIQQQIVSYAKSFANKGNKYKWGGYWNGSPKYTPTDCIGFVKGVYSHFGFKNMKNAPSGTQSFYRARHGIVTQVSEKDLQPSDLVLWKGHIAIYIGNGKIVHAAGKKYGVITGRLYKGKEFRGFYRVKGVK